MSVRVVAGVKVSQVIRTIMPTAKYIYATKAMRKMSLKGNLISDKKQPMDKQA